MSRLQLSTASVLLFLCVGVSAQAQNTDGRLYWTSQDAVRRAALDGSGVETLVVTQPFGAGALALDLQAAKIYWFQSLNEMDPAPFVRRANTNGTAVETLFSEFNGSALAVDSSNGKLYYAGLAFEQGCGRISRSNLDGSNQEQLIAGEASRGLALDLDAGKLYWTDQCDSAIKRADLDGSNSETLHLSESGTPFGIALDLEVGRIYWTALLHDDPTGEGIDSGAIFRSELDGSNAGIVVNGPLIWAIALDLVHDKMYWSEPNSAVERIRRADLDGSNVEEIASEVRSFGLAVDPLGVANVPAVSAWGAVCLLLLMLAAAVLVLRSKRVRP